MVETIRLRIELLTKDCVMLNIENLRKCANRYGFPRYRDSNAYDNPYCQNVHFQITASVIYKPHDD